MHMTLRLLCGGVTLAGAPISRYVLDVTVKVNGREALAGNTCDQALHTATLTFDALK